uniref:Uncharacterized protein n=1 Tax=Pristionchus pacificus TaxID=54126 RepID=A0A8R1V3D3_PRIPA
MPVWLITNAGDVLADDSDLGKLGCSSNGGILFDPSTCTDDSRMVFIEKRTHTCNSFLGLSHGEKEDAVVEEISEKMLEPARVMIAARRTAGQKVSNVSNRGPSWHRPSRKARGASQHLLVLSVNDPSRPTDRPQLIELAQSLIITKKQTSSNPVSIDPATTQMTRAITSHVSSG